jgi:hypothetical protein
VLFAVAGLALRELWISYRLITVLGAFVAAGAAVAILPATTAEAIDRFAAGTGLATAVAAALAGLSLGGELRRGSAGWLISRAVPRATLANGWLLAFSLPILLGMAAGGGLVWLTIAGSSTAPPPLAFAMAAAAATCGSLAMAALGLVLGAMLPPAIAGALALLATAAVAAISLGWPGAAAALPAAGHVTLAMLTDAPRPTGEALRAVGIGLATCGALLVLARAALERADL